MSTLNYGMLRLTSEFYRCPHNGRVLIASKGDDDKVMCGCGKTVLNSDPRSMVFDDAPGAHFKRFMPKATVEEYEAQEEAKTNVHDEMTREEIEAKLVDLNKRHGKVLGHRRADRLETAIASLEKRLKEMP